MALKLNQLIFLLYHSFLKPVNSGATETESGILLENAPINRYSNALALDGRSPSPFSKNDETDLSSSILRPGTSMLNSNPNITSFPANILDVQRIFAAHMIMIEKHRRLLQPAAERGNVIQTDLESNKDTAIYQDKLKEDDCFENIYNLQKDHKLTQQTPLDTNGYCRTFPPIFKSNTEVRESKFLLEYAKCYLETKELWEKFHRLGTEMIITKTGR